MQIEEIVFSNRGKQDKAQALNLRAGGRVFPVMSREETKGWLKERLAGARCKSEVEDLEAIVFPELDPEMVELVMEENPDEITLLGWKYRVEYREGQTPRVTLGNETVVTHGWRDLPDAGVKLPGGRLVEVVVSFGYYDKVSGSDIPELKARCLQRVHGRLWDSWTAKGRPSIAVPDPTDPEAVIPEVIECQYGISVVDGSALFAYGSVAFNPQRWSYDRWFVTVWYQSRDLAEQARTDAIAQLESMREKAAEQAHLERVRCSAVVAQERLGRAYHFSLSLELRERIDERRYAYLPSGLEALQAWTKETEKLIVEATDTLKSLADKKVEEERVKQEAAKRPATGEAVNVTLDALKAKFGKKR
jgi:hypothetical protein